MYCVHKPVYILYIHIYIHTNFYLILFYLFFHSFIYFLTLFSPLFYVLIMCDYVCVLCPAALTIEFPKLGINKVRLSLKVRFHCLEPTRFGPTRLGSTHFRAVSTAHSTWYQVLFLVPPQTRFQAGRSE